MQQGNGRWLKPSGWQKSLDEIRRFLDTWYFHISAEGHLYVRPLREGISGRDLHAFLRRLDVLGNSRLPESMTFDFKGVPMTHRRWCRLSEMIRRYADQIDTESHVIFLIPPSQEFITIPRWMGQQPEDSRR